MIIDVKKYLILGAKEDIDSFFTRPSNKESSNSFLLFGKKPIEVPVEIQHLLDAMRILRKLPVKKPYEGGGDLQYADETAQRIFELKAEVEKLPKKSGCSKPKSSALLLLAIFPWTISTISKKKGKRKIQFFCMKTAKSTWHNFSDEVIYIGTEYDLDYFIAINKEPRSYPDMIEMRIDRPLGELQTPSDFCQRIPASNRSRAQRICRPYRFSPRSFGRTAQ